MAQASIIILITSVFEIVTHPTRPETRRYDNNTTLGKCHKWNFNIEYIIQFVNIETVLFTMLFCINHDVKFERL